jgi:RNA polymerase sigma factor for flagellar operon FliA
MNQRSLGLTERNQLIERYLPYVRSIAGKIMKTLSAHIEFNDLVRHGEVGLIEAADRFDPKMGVNFKTFAYYRIRGAIYDGLREMGWLSRSQYAKQKFQEAATNYLASAAAAGDGAAQPLVQDEVNAVAEMVGGLVPIYITSLEAADALQIEDDRGPTASEELELGESRQVIQEAIEELAAQEREIIHMYYFQDLTLQEVSERLGLSKSWASRLHSRAVQHLQQLVAKRLGTDAPDSSKRNNRAKRTDK